MITGQTHCTAKGMRHAQFDVSLFRVRRTEYESSCPIPQQMTTQISNNPRNTTGQTSEAYGGAMVAKAPQDIPHRSSPTKTTEICVAKKEMKMQPVNHVNHSSNDRL
jgi:hypothetical protein